MRNQLKKISLFSVLGLGLLQSAVHGDLGGIGCPGEFGYAYAPPVIDPSCCGFSGHIDYLYLKGYNHLDVATILSRDTNTTINLTQNEFKEKTLTYDWDSGYKVGLNYRFPCDCWTLTFDWAHYDNKGSLFNQSDIGTGLFLIKPTYGLSGGRSAGTTDEIASTMSTEARLSFNEISLFASRDMKLGACLVFTPSVGLQSLFINHRLNYNLVDSNLTDADNLSIDFRGRNQVKTIGCFVGFDTNYLLFCGLGIYGKGAFGLHFSNFDLRVNETIYNPSSGDVIASTFDDSFESMIYNFNYGIGVRWLVPFSCNKSLFTLSLGWEGKYISDQNQYPVNNVHSENEYSFLPRQASNGLSLQGLVFSVSLQM